MAASIRLSTVRFARSLLFALALLAAPTASQAGILLTVNVAPPALPVYVQPVVPAPGYIWTPGYWAYSDDGYFWVPGTWVLAPYVGALWTPGWWGWDGGYWLWHAGYWGPRVGYYGGINYGFGYFGSGYYGGYWRDRVFTYNRSVTNVNITTIHNVYVQPWTGAVGSRVSYNGGTGGVVTRPTAEERLAERDRHVGLTPMQLQHQQFASTNRAQFASVNHGMPGITATHRVAAFNNPGSALTHNGSPAAAALNAGAMHRNAVQGSGAPVGQTALEHRGLRKDAAGMPQGMVGSQNTNAGHGQKFDRERMQTMSRSSGPGQGQNSGQQQHGQMQMRSQQQMQQQMLQQQHAGQPGGMGHPAGGGGGGGGNPQHENRGQHENKKDQHEEGHHR